MESLQEQRKGVTRRETEVHDSDLSLGTRERMLTHQLTWSWSSCMDAEGRESRRKTGVTGVSGHSECWLGSEGRTNSRIYITKRGPIASAGCHTKEINELTK